MKNLTIFFFCRTPICKKAEISRKFTSQPLLQFKRCNFILGKFFFVLLFSNCYTHFAFLLFHVPFLSALPEPFSFLPVFMGFINKIPFLF